ncbi:hypothetical protein [Streptomyces sp. NPDC021020]|uniref:hypothetical protein n=1 Tax=Streptomyces sp. NPDC021020 TaxID=3365109 RepID=UPI0037A77E08
MPRLAARFAASLTAAAVAAAPAVLACAAPARAADAVHQPVTAADLGPQGPWLRLQDDPGNAGRPFGTQEVSPFADPVRFNGSLHLAVTGAAEAQQSQAAHYFTAPVAFGDIAAAPLSYDLYVRGSSTPSAIAGGANLQLPGFCGGAFTTLSFQPQLATDTQGRTGAVADIWRHFDAGGAALWRTSRAVGSFAAGSDHPFGDYVAACGGADSGAIGVIANVGRLGDASANLDTYVDNLTVDGTVYDFLVDGAATGSIHLAPTAPGGPGHPGTYDVGGTPARVGALPASVRGGGGHGGGDGCGDDTCSLAGEVVFTSPADGPYFTEVGTRLVLSRPGGLHPDDVTVTAGGEPVTLTEGPDGTLVAVVTPAAATDLAPGGTYRTSLTVTCADGSTGPVTVTAELLARGYEPLQPTGVLARP